MTAALPRITIVTPSYNQGRYLEKTILSVLDQRYPNLEYIIMDGGSSDDSVDIIKRYEKFLARWVSERDGGQAEAINRGFKLSAGDILGWLNSDDYFEPGALKIVAEHAQRFPEVGAFVGHGRIVDVAGHETHYIRPNNLSFETFCNWLSYGHFPQPSCFFRRWAWDLAGPLDETLNCALDVDLWLRMVKQAPFRPIDTLLSTALAHSEAKTVALRHYSKAETVFVVARAGGADFVRKPLDELAAAVTRYEMRKAKILSFPLAGLVWRIARIFLGPRTR
jgi:glycosyltransferase involved in cell wall biosynthesis